MNNYKTEGKNGEQGAISIAFALSVVVLVFLLAVTSMSYIGSDTKGASNQLIKNKALYAAEAGIELVLGELKNFGDGVFTDVAIGEALVSSTVADDTVFTVTATVDDISQSIQIVAKTQGGVLPDAFYYAVSSFNTGKKLRFQNSHSPYLNGDIFTLNNSGDVVFGSNWVLGNVTVHVEEGTPIDNNSSYSYSLDEYSSGNPPLTWPTLDTQYYDDYINNVGGYSDYGSDNISSNLNLSSFTDNVLFHDNSLTIDGYTVTGPGKIVATNTITIKNGGVIGPDVELISANDLKLYSGSQVTGMGSILYGTNLVEITDSFTSAQGAFISPTQVTLDCDSDLPDRGIIQGIVYGAVKVKTRHSRIHGSIVTDYIDGEDFHCTHMDYNLSYLPTTVPPGFTPGSGSNITVTVTNGTWKVQ